MSTVALGVNGRTSATQKSRRATRRSRTNGGFGGFTATTPNRPPKTKSPPCGKQYSQNYSTAANSGRSVPQTLKPARRGSLAASVVDVNLSQLDACLIVSVNPKSKTPLGAFVAAVIDWTYDVDCDSALLTPERRSEVRYRLDLGTEAAPDPTQGAAAFAGLLERLQRVGQRNEVIHAEIIDLFPDT